MNWDAWIPLLTLASPLLSLLVIGDPFSISEVLL